MYSIKVDTHVHSLYSVHAYNTIDECSLYASKKNMEAIAIADHFGPLFQSENLFQYVIGMTNRSGIPKYLNGVRVIRGIELDIIDLEGNIAYYNQCMEQKPDMTILDLVMKSVELSIASVHMDRSQSGTILQNTNMYVNAISNPYVNIIGHSGRSGYNFEIDTVVKAAMEHNKIIEINNHSLDGQWSGVNNICQKIAEKCAELDVNIVVSSDSHHGSQIGDFSIAENMLKEINFPEKLIVNKDLDRLTKFIGLDN